MFLYTSLTKCAECGKLAMCSWNGEAIAKGKWICYKCRYPISDQLSDAIKEVSSRETKSTSEG